MTENKEDYRGIWLEIDANGMVYYEGTINDVFYEGWAGVGTSLETVKATIDRLLDK